MKTKTYTAPTFREALLKIKAEMGSSALIVDARDLPARGHTRTGKPSESGSRVQRTNPVNLISSDTGSKQIVSQKGNNLFNKSGSSSSPDGKGGLVEVVAAYPPQEIRAMKEPVNGSSLTTIVQQLSDCESRSGLRKPDSILGKLVNNVGSTSHLSHEFERELREIKGTLKTLTSLVRSRQVSSSGTGSQPVRSHRQDACATEYEFPGAFQQLYSTLIAHEVQYDLAKNLLERAMERLPANQCSALAADAQYDDRDAAQQCLLGEIQESMKAEVISVPNDGNQNVVAFVGPTGVGKTTTIAKLAANYSLKEKINVALITIDTYRIAAVEQLRAYADMIGIPLKVVFTPDELRKAVRGFADASIVFIDTIGRSHLDQMKIQELRGFLSTLEGSSVEIHLVISARTSHRDALDIFDSFNIMPIDRLLFSKIDETKTFGQVLSVTQTVDLPLSYLTTGQEVPDDIEPADPQKIAKLLMIDPAAQASCL